MAEISSELLRQRIVFTIKVADLFPEEHSALLSRGDAIKADLRAVVQKALNEIRYATVVQNALDIRYAPERANLPRSK